MPEYTHRDRRAQRDVGRAFWSVVGVSVGLIGLAMAVPFAFVGILAVVALGVLGAISLGWSERLLSGYTSDLARVRDGTATDGFVRVETYAMVGPERSADAPRSPSPHARRRSRARPSDPSESGGSESDQV